MLYTPLSARKRRSTKTLIDVGFDRLGTVVAAGMVMGVLAAAGARAEIVLLVLAIAIAVMTLARSRALHTGYVGVLEESLREEVKGTVAADSVAVGAEEPVAIRDEIGTTLMVWAYLRACRHRDAGCPRALEVSEDVSQAARKYNPQLRASLRAIGELRSCDRDRVHRVLSSEAPLAPPVVSFAILLLAHKEFHPDAIRALRASVANSTGQIVDALCDDHYELDVRRRIPRVLSECLTRRCGRWCGVADERFEVRTSAPVPFSRSPDATRTFWSPGRRSSRW
jgi:hypothetical protein